MSEELEATEPVVENTAEETTATESTVEETTATEPAVEKTKTVLAPEIPVLHDDFDWSVDKRNVVSYSDCSWNSGRRYQRGSYFEHRL
jgi:hypothetical protein